MWRSPFRGVGNSLRLNADEVRVKQILVNLFQTRVKVTKAKDISPDRGRLYRKRTRFLQITVRDDGPG